MVFRNNVVVNKVCKLRKALYGLKQLPRARLGRFFEVMLAMRYKQSREEYTLFINHSKTREVTALIVYIDNIIIIENDD